MVRVLTFVLVILLSACGGDGKVPAAVESTEQSARLEVETVRDVYTGELIYVPVYSHIYSRNERSAIKLTVTLSVRNTDAENALSLNRIDYFDSDGGLVRSYLTRPATLGPLASRSFVIEEKDMTGGSGANFLVDWSSDADVTEPIVEAVMISTAGSQGISFVSVGRVLEKSTSATGAVDEE